MSRTSFEDSMCTAHAPALPNMRPELLIPCQEINGCSNTASPVACSIETLLCVKPSDSLNSRSMCRLEDIWPSWSIDGLSCTVSNACNGVRSMIAIIINAGAILRKTPLCMCVADAVASIHLRFAD